jgi:hypothetical protein
MGRLTGIVVASLVVVLVGCGSSSDDGTPPGVGEITGACADMGNMSEIESSKEITCDEAHEIAKQAARACGDPSQACAFGGGGMTCDSTANGETSKVRCTTEMGGRGLS